jgi:hypothetical protein
VFSPQLCMAVGFDNIIRPFASLGTLRVLRVTTMLSCALRVMLSCEAFCYRM